MFPVWFSLVLGFLKIRRQKDSSRFIECEKLWTFCLSLVEPFPRIMILQWVSFSSCFAVSPLGPNIRPTKLNCKGKPSHLKVSRPNFKVLEEIVHDALLSLTRSDVWLSLLLWCKPALRTFPFLEAANVSRGHDLWWNMSFSTCGIYPCCKTAGWTDRMNQTVAPAVPFETPFRNWTFHKNISPPLRKERLLSLLGLQ